jgi:hypothetical protein
MAIAIENRSKLWRSIQDRTLGLLLLLAMGFALIPVWSVQMPAMPDYPGHIARMYYLTAGASDPILNRFYQIEWGFIPNLAMDLVVPPLTALFPLEDAGRVFISLCIVLWVAGPMAIHWALYRRLGLMPLVAVIFTFNGNFFWGFLNYVFGAGLAFMGLALWILAEQWRPTVRTLVFALIASAVFFSHLYAFAAFALMIGAYELGVWLEDRPRTIRGLWYRELRAGLPFVPAALIFLFLSPHGVGSELVVFKPLETLHDRVAAVAQTQFYDADPLLIGLLALLVTAGLAIRAVTLHRRMIPVVAFLVLAALLSPVAFMNGWGGHLRLPAVAACLLFAGFDIRRGFGRAAAICVALLGAVQVWHMTILIRAWQHYDRQITEFRAALNVIRPGSKLFLADDYGQDWSAYPVKNEALPLYWHIGELAIMDRQSYSANFFAFPGMQVSLPTPAARSFTPMTTFQNMPVSRSHLAELASGEIRTKKLATHWPHLSRWPCQLDYLIEIRYEKPNNPMPDRLIPIHDGSFFSIYQIARPASCGPADAANEKGAAVGTGSASIISVR